MNYKALILDLDGTTMPSGLHELPRKSVVEAIAKAKDKIHVCIATGRPFQETKHLIDRLALSGPCIVSGGAQIYDPIKKRIIREIYLPKTVIPQIVAIAKRYSLKVGILYSEHNALYTKNLPLDSAIGVYIPSIPQKIVSAVEKELSAISAIALQKMPSWENNRIAIDVTNAKATKLHGIQHIMSIMHVTKEETIGVGDSYNDLPLLLACGFKIAMGNAIPELKAIADYIAPSVEEDGVVAIIEKFILSS